MGDPGTEEVHLNEEVQFVMDQRRQATQRRVMKRRTLTMGFHHGFFHALPPTWTFSIMTCYQLIDNWYVGNNIEKIPSLEVFSTLHVLRRHNYVVLSDDNVSLD